ncbi:hypothetical protein HTS88_17800 [Pseudarthrobacter oxydans]|uniref:acyltransferase family protein n=1 Tax=Pseudarthrobacter oxydans TaxID=1671 RepID=UPI0015734DCB|nr:acyltransferase family protein [Pseudarthrobacter oxydans]NSX38243.1 hypothetical protein [Pseudarthrobacter oxydans]
MGDSSRIFYDPPSYPWYLAYLLIFYIVALIAPPRVRQWAIPVALVGAFFIQDGNWSQMLYLLAFFFLGDFVMRNWQTLEHVVSMPAFIWASAALAVGASLASALGIEVRHHVWWAPCVAAAVFVLLLLAKALSTTKPGAIIGLAGRQSIVFYTTHYVFLMVIFNVLARIGLDNSLVHSIILPITAVALGVLFVRLRRLRFIDVLFVFPSR